MKKKLVYLIIDLLFIALICYLVNFFVDFKLGNYLLSGDFRFNINQGFAGDQYTELINKKFSYNNFIFLSFYSLFYFFSFLPYQFSLIYIFFGIPVLLFLSMKYAVLKITGNSDSIFQNIFISALAFYFALNPSVFIRYGHFTVLQGSIFYPVYLFCLFKFLREKSLINIYFLILPLLLWLSISPQLAFVNFITALVLYFSVFILWKPTVKEYLLKGAMVFFAFTIAFMHVLYPVLIGYGQAKSSFESETTGFLLSSFAKNSDILTALSGTNFYDINILINFPSQMSVGWVIFILTVFFYATRKTLNKINFLLATSIIALAVIVTGYNSFSFVFNFMNNTFLKNFTWLVKDPHMYYLILIVPILFLLSRLVIFRKVRSVYLLIISFFIISLNVFYVLKADRANYKNAYDFVKVPNEYFLLADELEKDNGRNFWLPNSAYVSKSFSGKLMYFPTPSLWLTKNKELFYYTVSQSYRSLSLLIEEEIYVKNCKNINFLNWIIAAQNLNVIVDENSVNNSSLKEFDVERRIQLTEKCVDRLPNVYKYKSFGKIDVYKSNLKLKKELFEVSGTLEELDNFLKENPVDIIYRSSGKNSSKRLNVTSYTILNESFDENWFGQKGEKPIDKVNLSSVLFKENVKDFHYRGESEFKIVTLIQRFLILFLFLAFIAKLYMKKPVKT